MQIALVCYWEGQLLSLLEVLLHEFASLQEHRPTRFYSRAANLLQSMYSTLCYGLKHQVSFQQAADISVFSKRERPRAHPLSCTKAAVANCWHFSPQLEGHEALLSPLSVFCA